MRFTKLVPFAGYLFAMACTPQLVHAQPSDPKVAVSVEHSGQDSVGRQFAYAVKEALRASNGFRLVLDRDSGLQINIVTLNPSNSESSWTVAAISYTMTNFLPLEKGNPQTWYPIFLTTHVMTIGSQRIQEQSRSVMAALDEQLERYRRDSRN